MTKIKALELLAKHKYVKISENLWANPNGEDTMSLVKKGNTYSFDCQFTPKGVKAVRQYMRDAYRYM